MQDTEIQAMKHKKFEELKILTSAGMPVLLHGERGTGKTTLVRQVAEDLALEFYVLSMTRQTTLSHILGFMNVNGVYVPSLFRKAVEFGGVFLLDELDAADPNVILSLNTLENGFISFPDTVIDVHKDFRLIATSNPFNGHSQYTGRAVLDAATLDRFDKIALDRDSLLEASLVSEGTYKEIENMREAIKSQNSHIHISMRDTLRWETRKTLGLTENYVEDTLLEGDDVLQTIYWANQPKVKVLQQDMKTIDALWDSIKPQTGD